MVSVVTDEQTKAPAVEAPQQDRLDRFQHFPDHDCVKNIDDPSHAKIGIHPFPDRLHVLTMVQNPLRWRSRYRNYEALRRHVEDSGGILYTAEVAFGERHFEITEPNNPQHLQLRCEHEPWRYEVWLKECTLNAIMHSRLPLTAKYVAWIDSDIHFTRTDWCQETLHLLQHYQFLQLFSHTMDLGPNSEPLGQSVGMVFKRFQDPQTPMTGYYYYYGKKKGLWVHPGFAWAARRDALDDVGGLIDWAILGSGDWLMGAALFGEVRRALSGGYSTIYKRWAYNWQDRAEQYIKRNVGYLPGLIVHRYHGRKMDRNYDTRWKLLVSEGFNPETDIIRDVQGLYRLTDRSITLRDGLRHYTSIRNEDTTEV